MSKLDRFIFISFALHISIMLIFAISEFLFPSKSISFERAIRIDMIALPDKVDPNKSTVASPPAANPKNEPLSQNPTSELSKVTTPSLLKKTISQKEILPKNNLNSAVNKINQLSAIDKLSKSVQVDEQLNAQLKNLVFKGNVLADGNSLKGLAKLEAEEYVFQVEDHIRSRWKIPQWMVGKSYRAKVLVKWDSGGNLTLVQFIESSSNDSFDEVVMNTIQAAAPFPAPPEKFVAMMRKQGVIFGFPE